MPTLEVSDPISRRLLRRTTSFADSAEDVIERLLDLAEGRQDVSASSTASHQRHPERATPGSILPEREYWRPILAIVAEAGGAAPARYVMDLLGERMKD